MPDLSPPLEISSCFQRLQMVAKFLWMMIRPRSITSSSSAVVASHAILVGSRHQARLVSSVPSRMSSLLRLLVFAVQSYVLSTLEHLPHWLNREPFTFNLDRKGTITLSNHSPCSLRLGPCIPGLVCLVAVFLPFGIASSMATIVLASLNHSTKSGRKVISTMSGKTNFLSKSTIRPHSPTPSVSTRFYRSVSLGVCVNITTCDDIMLNNYVNSEHIYPKTIQVHIGIRMPEILNKLNTSFFSWIRSFSVYGLKFLKDA